MCNLFLESWSSPSFKGQRPPPCADLTLISVDDWRAVLYGGHRAYDHDSKDLYIIDFSTMVYTSRC